METTMSEATATNGQLKAFLERIERVEEDMDALKEDRKSIYDELKGEGYDAKIMRRVVRLRKQDPAKCQMEQAEVDLYLADLGEI